MVTVDGRTISLECNRNYNNSLFTRNISHLRRMIIQNDFEIVQINIDNYDIGGRDKLIYEYSLKEKDRKGDEIYENLIKYFPDSHSKCDFFFFFAFECSNILLCPCPDLLLWCNVI